MKIFTKTFFVVCFLLFYTYVLAQENLPTNNTCENASWIDLMPNGQLTSVQISHTDKTLENEPECYDLDDLIADSYYNIVVPPSGDIRFEHNYSYGINIFDNCNGTSLFCNFLEKGIMDVENLAPGDTILVQLFQRFPQTWNYYFYCPYPYDNCPPYTITEPKEFYLSVREYIDPSNNYCHSAELIDIENLSFEPKKFKIDKNPTCSEDEIYSDVFYKFIVPSSGAVKLSRYIDYFTDFYGYDYEFFYGGLALYADCNEAPIFCKSNESLFQSFNFDLTYEDYGSVIIAELNPNDTLILQLFSEIAQSYTTTFEIVKPTINNTCKNATSIELNQDIDCSLSTAFSLKENSLNKESTCAGGAYADMFFEATVPESGSIQFNLSYPMGLAVYESCQANPVFCKSEVNPNQTINNLTPNSNVIIQLFNYFDQPEEFSFCLEETSPVNIACKNASWFSVTAEENFLEYVIHKELAFIEFCSDYGYAGDFVTTHIKFVVPPTGRIEFVSHSGTSFSYILRIFENSCTEEAFFCERGKDFGGRIDISDLIPGDTLVAQITERTIDALSKITVQEVGSLPNNTCKNPTLIDLKPDGLPTYVQIDHSSNSYDGGENCYWRDIDPFIDSYYNLIVPASGSIRFVYNYFYGVNVFKNCDSESIFCDYKSFDTEDEIDVENLNPGDTLLIQVFQLKPGINSGESEVFYLSVKELMPQNNTIGNCHIDDWTALKALYESTNGENWNNSSGWGQVAATSPPENCNLSLLYGVSLNTEGRVSCIDLDGIDDCTFSPQSLGNNLVGPIPDEIYLLSKLSELCLNFNKISGVINMQLSKLSDLKMLLLHGNELRGAIPFDLFDNLQNLEFLYFSSNQLTGVVPYTINKCISLTHLGLYENQLRGNIPRTYGLKNLQVLNLRNNQFNGSFSKELSEIPTLKSLYLSNNQLSGYYDVDLKILCDQLDYPNAGYLIDNGNKFKAEWDNFCQCGAGINSSDKTNPIIIEENTQLKNVYQHTGDILTIGNVVVGLHQDESVTFSANNVFLYEGFEVKKGSSFLAEYAPCK